jgi:hypothetical protein
VGTNKVAASDHKLRDRLLLRVSGQIRNTGGAGGIRTLDRALQPYNGLANRRLQPLGHSSIRADMPDAGASRKRQISGWRIPDGLMTAAAEPKRGSKAVS